MKKCNTILAGAGALALMTLGGLLAGCAHQEAAPPLATPPPVAPTVSSTSQHSSIPEDTAAKARQRGFTVPNNAGTPGNK